MIDYRAHRQTTQAKAFDLVTAWQIRKTESDKAKGRAARKAK